MGATDKQLIVIIRITFVKVNLSNIYIYMYIPLLTSNFVYIGGGKQSQEMRDL